MHALASSKQIADKTDASTRANPSRSTQPQRSDRAGSVLGLQRAIGNMATRQLMQGARRSQGDLRRSNPQRPREANVATRPRPPFTGSQAITTTTFTATDEETMRAASTGGIETYTSTCCPDDEHVAASTANKFTVHDVGARPAAGGTEARYTFGYTGHADNTGPFCQCSCCAFVQFVRGFFEVNGTRLPHTLPGSGLPLSPTVMRQDSPLIPHVSCWIPGVGTGMLTDTPGLRGISATDNITVDLEFDARTVDTCASNAIVASRNFHLVISGTHPRTFSATGDIV